MAKYTVRGFALRNRTKTLNEALTRALPDDDVIWNGKEGEVGLEIANPLRIEGANHARMKVPEHAVGLRYSGSGNGYLSSVEFYCKQICNAINIEDWTGSLEFDSIISSYNTKKREKAYPTFVAAGLDNLSLVIRDSQINNIVIDGVQDIKISNSNFAESETFKASQLSIDKSNILDDSEIEGTNSYELSNLLVDRSSIAGTGTISSVIVNKELDISGTAQIDKLSFKDENVILKLSNGTFTFTNTDLSNIKLVTDNAEIVAKENTKLPKDYQSNNSKVSNQTVKNSKGEALKELDSLIGLNSVKKTIHSYVNVARVNAARKRAGLQNMDLSLHMVYSGSPGTGKTTVAEIVGRILFEEGLMPTSKFVHVGRKDLVSNHVGETAIKTGQKVQEALGGILFIDEAYSLLPADNNGKDFGTEAIDTLTDEIEKHHNDLIVVLAGYTQNMKDFFNRANPGLKSRFSTWVEFPDYSVDELYEIAEMKLKKQQFNPSDEVNGYIYSALKNFAQAHVINGNGRFVRTFVQEITFAQSNRITESGSLDPSALTTITPEDVQIAYNNYSNRLLEN